MRSATLEYMKRYGKEWGKTARLEWVNTSYPTYKIRKREASRFTLKHYRLTQGDTLLANFRNLPDAKRYAEDVITQSAKTEVFV